MKSTIIPVFAIFTLLLASCDEFGIRGNRHIVTDQRTVGEFSEIDAAGAFSIEWRTGAPSFAVTADENLLPYIESTLSGKTLRLRTRERLRPSRTIKVVATGPHPAGADLAGAVHFEARQLSGPKFYFRSAGASRIILAGQVDELLGEMTGATKLEAEELQAKTVQIAATGASKAEVSVSEVLRVSITGAGKVIYSGNPKTIERDITGAGRIEHKE